MNIPLTHLFFVLQNTTPFLKWMNTNAGVAQLVEHHLAKVDVEGSNPFARSIARAVA